jgi:carbamoyl-phosphate synthase large subunit
MRQPHCVLVTGVGAIIGQGILRSLRMLDRPVRIIGIDLNENAFGAHDCDVFYAKPTCEDGEEYRDFFRRLVENESVELIIPGIEHDIFYLDANREFFREIGLLLALNQHALIELSRDKWATAKALEGAGISVIPSLIPTTWDECTALLGPPPLLLKPRSGNGSRGISRLRDKRDFDYWTGEDSGQFLVQKIVGTDDQEYTASVFGFGDDGATVPIIFRRRLSANGSTLSAEVVQHATIEELISRLNALFRPLGPTNYQFRVEGESVYLLEVNPRISSATSLRSAFGFNEACMCVDYFLDKKRPAPIPAQHGKATRYVADFVEV